MALQQGEECPLKQGKGTVNGCGLGLALKPAPPGVLAHKAGECKHCLGR